MDIEVSYSSYLSLGSIKVPLCEGKMFMDSLAAETHASLKTDVFGSFVFQTYIRMLQSLYNSGFL